MSEEDQKKAREPSRGKYEAVTRGKSFTPAERLRANPTRSVNRLSHDE